MDVSRWEVESYEPGGQDRVAWLIDPDGTRWLFKPVIVRSDRRQGEDWAEKIAAKLATLVKLPAARIELGTRHERTRLHRP